VLSPFRIVILFFVLSILGLAVIWQLKVDLQPNYTLPKLVVTYALPQAPPEVVEMEATAPLENVFSQLSGLKKIESVSNYNQGYISLEFDKHTDIAFKKFELSTLIRQVYPQLNQRLSYPNIDQRDPKASQRNSSLLIYRIYAPLAPYQIRNTVNESIRKEITQISGVASAEISGADELQISISYQPEVLQAKGFFQQDIAQTLQSHFFRMYPGAYSNEAGQKIFIEVANLPEGMDTLEKLKLKNKNGDEYFLRDLAHIYIEESEPTRYFRINGKSAVSLSIMADEGLNRLVLANTLKEIVDKAAGKLPAGYEVRLEYDDTLYLKKELDKIYLRATLSVLILCIFIFLINRSGRYLLVLFSGIVVNVSLCLLAAYLFGIEIHLYSIAGLTISFGLMVDNAIVMIDHIHRKKNLHIFTALLAATGTTIAALSLVFFLPEQDQLNLNDFSFVVAIALALSLFVALFFTPAMYRLMYGEEYQHKKVITWSRWRVKVFQWYGRSIGFISNYRKSFITLLILMFGLPVFLLPTRIDGQEWYNKTIGADVYQENVRPHVDKWLGGSLRLFVRYVFEKSTYRTPEQTRLYVNGSMTFGNTPAQMNFVMQSVENYLSQVEGIDQYITQVNSGQYASIQISFKPEYENGALPYMLKGRLIAKSLDWGGVEWSVYGVGRGFSNRTGEDIPNFRVIMKGYNYDELERQAEILADKLIQHRRIQKVNTNERLSWNEKSSQELLLRVDAERLAQSGLSQTSLAGILSTHTPPLQASSNLSINNQLFPVYIKPVYGDRFSTYDVQQQTFQLDEQNSIRPGDFSELKLQRTSNAVHKENRQYIRHVGFDYYGSSKFGNEYLEEVLTEMRATMPLGYEAKKAGWDWSWSKVKRQYSLLAVLIVAVFFICAILFESLRQPFFIIITIPLSFIGLFLTFSWFDFYFDQGGYAAFVLLGGLAVNAAIFVLNDFNALKKRYNHNRALLKAVWGKARPILLTILSTCFGLLPFVMEGQQEIFWFSLAVGTMGGLIFSLFAVFISLPVLGWRKK
jgi:multidrug efflux pump subunit AcrB